MLVKIQSKEGFRIIDLNRREAVRESCLNCSGWYPGEVQNCTFTECSLYPFRMAEGKQSSKARRKAIRKYCLWCMSGKPSDIRNCPSVHCPLYSYRLSSIDRSQEIDSEPKKDQIGHGFEAKSGSGIPEIGQEKGVYFEALYEQKEEKRNN